MLLSTTALLFTSCKKKEEEPKQETYTRMTVDINPSVEFMVDSQNKVVSVTALNDDGSILIAGEVFIGLSAEAAAEKIVALAEETGYLVHGALETVDNVVKISVAGTTELAAELITSVESHISAKLEALDIEGKIEKAEALHLDGLRALAMETALFTEEEVNAMTEQQLYSAIAAGRVETAELLTKEMRQAYLSAKESKISFAESEATAAVINAMGGIYNLTYIGYKTAVDAYSASITALDEFRYNSLVSPDSEYQKSLAKLREAKTDMLKQRKYVASLDVNGTEYVSASITLQMSEEQYNKILSAYETLGNTLNSTLESLIAKLRENESILRSLEDKFSDNIKEELKAKASELEASVNEAKDGFFAEFEEAHKDDIAAVEQALINQKNLLKENATGAN